MLAGYLLMLRFFAAVQRHGAESGLPFSATMHVGVQQQGGAEGCQSQLEPYLSMHFPCRVQGITIGVELRLQERHDVHVAQWYEHTDTLLRNLRTKYEADGYAPSFMIPDELVETKERLRSLEQRLMHLHWFYRLRRRGFEQLLREIRAVRAQTAPALIDPRSYR
jgi:hypothetical protein